MNNIDIVNDFYMTYDNKLNSLINLLSKSYKVTYKYTTKYTKEYFPLPVISVKNICEIVFNEYEIDINTKISKDDLLNLNFNKLKNYDFDIYPTCDYYDDLYEKGMSNKEVLEKIKKVKYKNLGMTFIVPLDMNNTQIRKLIDLLSNNKFKY